MNILFKGVFLILFITFSGYLIGQDSLKVLTYNIQGMKPGTHHVIRLGFIIDKIKKLDPDIIGLQEINEPLDGNGDDNQCRKIASTLSEHFNIQYTCYQQFTHLSWDNQFREFIGIITKHPVLDSGYHQLATGVFPRKVVWNSIDTPLGIINFFNTHLSFNSSAVRLEQAGQIMEYTNEIITDYPASASFMTGDFNDSPSAASIELITNPGTDTTFIDSYALSNPGLPGYTVPSNSPNSRIDYVFMSNVGNLNADTSFVVNDTAIFPGIYSSDHLAVLGVFKEGSNGTGQDIQINENFKLFQNYPNPSDGFTTITYVLNKPAHIKLSIISQLGVEVETLADAYHSAGKYSIRLDTSDLTDNFYFYSLKSNISVQAKLMSVIR